MRTDAVAALARADALASRSAAIQALRHTSAHRAHADRIAALSPEGRASYDELVQRLSF